MVMETLLLSHKVQKGLPCFLNSSERNLGVAGSNPSPRLSQQFVSKGLYVCTINPLYHVAKNANRESVVARNLLTSSGNLERSPYSRGDPGMQPAVISAELKGLSHCSVFMRYFVLDFETGILQYFVNEQSKNQKPRGTLSLAGAIISPSDEVPHMLVVYSASGEMYKLRAADAKEKQYWITQLRSCAKHHKEGNSKSVSSRSRSSSLLPPGTVNSASPSGQKHMNQSGPTVVTITHHKSPAAARRAKSQRSGQLHEVREMMSQAEGQQKNLVQAIEALPSSGPLSALDQDLLLLKATSAATLSCLGECLTLLQQSMHQVAQHHNRSLSSEGILGWPGPKSHSTEQLKNGALSSLSSASANLTWAIVPSAVQDGQALQPNTEHSASELILVEDEMTDTEDNEEEDLGVLDDQRSVILHLISQLKLGMDLTR
ncbi:PREDICTED: oxysterol-binding protein-related protein 10-like, partial [Mesitornis unicolor]|uniref:oxysterol-binding protein-related protein 10-like n=1 Tax=Mesitornis unicolor TaxID=54374 RepID=UPI000528F463